MRRAARTDANHAAIRDALRTCGWRVIDCARVGGGWPDLIASHRVKGIRFVEVKDGAKKPSARKLTAAEVRVHQQFAEAGCPIVVIERVDQIQGL